VLYDVAFHAREISVTTQQFNPFSIAANGARSLPQLLAVVSLAISALMVIPLQPIFVATPGLDPSWAFALNEAVARHLVFGRDVVFTFGPFASVYTTFYHPATDAIMLIGSAILAAGLCAGFVYLGLERRPILLLLLPLIIAQAQARDPIFFAVPLLFMLSIYRISIVPADDQADQPTLWAIALILVMACTMGTLPLVKGSFAGLAAVQGGLAVLMLALTKRTRLAGLVVLVALASLGIGWTAAGQHISDLPHFFIAESPIISAYSEAMSLHGPFLQIAYWGAAAIVIVVFFHLGSARQNRRIGALAIVGVLFYLFITFKAGFVRAAGHQHMSAVALLFCALAIAMFIDKKPAIIVCVATLAGWTAIEYSMPDYQPGFALQRTYFAYQLAHDGLERRIGHPEFFSQSFAQENTQIRNQVPIHGISGNADIYPYDLSILFANQIGWDGRPTFQSYSAYHPKLDQANANHLTGRHAPDNVLFRVGTIDGRLPSMDDALSWAVLLRNYTITGQESGYLKMIRSLPPRSATSKIVMDTDASVGDLISIPQTDSLVIARIHMRPTLLGRAVLAVFKLPQVHLEIMLSDGRSFQFRYIPEMGDTGFVLSPLVQSNADFISMASGNVGSLRVTQARLITPSLGLWNRSIHVTLEGLKIAPQAGQIQTLGISANSAARRPTNQ
jgi:hypothetical protein